jgi:hypothetical protein
VGPALFAGGLIGQAFAIRDAVNDTFADFPLPPKAAVDAANDAFTTGPVADWSLALLGVGLLVGAATILISLNARRAGLLSSFMGILGVIVGVLFVLPLLGQLPVVQFFWVAALGALFLNRWPTDRGPAWETGEPDPWPTAAELRAEAQAEADDSAAERRGEPQPLDEGGDYEPVEEEYEDVTDEQPAAPAHPRSKKRKRKRRR